MRTPAKMAWRTNGVAELTEEDSDEGGAGRPQALSASACEQVRAHAPAAALSFRMPSPALCSGCRVGRACRELGGRVPWMWLN